MGSMHWSDEESRYLQALLTWQGDGSEKEKLARSAVEPLKTVGEFRVLVVGAKGVGKTSILTRVSTLERKGRLR